MSSVHCSVATTPAISAGTERGIDCVVPTQPHTSMQMFTRETGPAGWEAAYERDGFYVLEDCLTIGGREQLTAEVMRDPRCRTLPPPSFPPPLLL